MRPRLIAFLSAMLVAAAVDAAGSFSLDYSPLFHLSNRAAANTAVGVPVADAPAPRPFAVEGVSALRLECPFQSSASSRAAWDIPVRADLRAVAGIRFKLRILNPEAFSYFTFYFKSGDGWFVREFSAGDHGEWSTIEIRKAETGIEGAPSGWRDISALRISAWRGDGSNGALEVAAIGVIPARPEVVVARGTTEFHTLPPGEQSSVLLYPRRVVELLENYGIEPTLVEESDLAHSTLNNAQVLILPYNPGSSHHAAAVLSRFIERGGRVVGFYTIPNEIAEAIGMRVQGGVRAAAVPGGFVAIRPIKSTLPGAPDRVPQRSWIIHRLEAMPGIAAQPLANWENGRNTTFAHPAILATNQAVWFAHVLLNDNPNEGGRLLLASVGRCWPDAWRTAAIARYRRIADNLPFPNFDSAVRSLTQTDNHRPQVARELNAAIQARRNGSILLERKAFPAAIRLFEYATERLTEAYLHSRRPADEKEFRAAWCHNGDGAGESWSNSVRTLKKNGFNVLIANVMNAGMAWFPSRHLPPSPSVADGENPLRDLVAACRAYNVQSHAWIMCFRLGDRADQAFVKQTEADGGFQVRFNGEIDRLWLCPNNPSNQAMLLGGIREILASHAVDGIHLDYIRYPGPDTCFCPHCRAAFEQFIGQRVTPWPAAIRRNPELATKWNQFRRRSINSFVAAVHGLVEKTRPRVLVSAAVFRNETGARNSIAQDWPTWAGNRWVDFVCPMNYTENLAAFEHSTARQLRLGQRLGLPVFPGIGLTSHHVGAVGAIQQIETTRRLETKGFVIFQFNHDTANNEFADFAKGATHPR